MKKKMAAVLAAALMMAMAPQEALCAVKADQVSEQESKGYEFVWGTVRIAINQKADDILKSLGDAESIFEQDSCAYQGKDRIYSYGSFELSTYPVGKEEHVSSVYFLDKNAQTEEGIKIGSSYTEMIKAYGKDYQVENEVYRYQKDGMELVFYMTGKTVDGIEYLLVSEQ